MPYHVLMSVRTEADAEVKLDLTEQELITRIINPYNVGNPITITGRNIPVNDIRRIRIFFYREILKRNYSLDKG